MRDNFFAGTASPLPGELHPTRDPAHGQSSGHSPSDRKSPLQ